MKRTTIILALVLTLSLLSGCATDQKENTATVSGTEIQFSDGKITASSTDGVEIDGTALTITDAGTYVLSGSCADGSVTVEKGAELRDSILFKGTRVRDGVTLRYVITDKYVEVLPGRTLMGHESYPIVISKGSIV